MKGDKLIERDVFSTIDFPHPHLVGSWFADALVCSEVEVDTFTAVFAVTNL